MGALHLHQKTHPLRHGKRTACRNHILNCMPSNSYSSIQPSSYVSQRFFHPLKQANLAGGRSIHSSFINAVLLNRKNTAIPNWPPTIHTARHAYFSFNTHTHLKDIRHTTRITTYNN
ncbi:hypothetical protein EMIT0357P_220007 [Pseudomonas marginalis]